MDDPNKQSLEASDSLETIDATPQSGVVDAPSGDGTGSPAPTTGAPKPKDGLLKKLKDKVNIYILILIGCMLVLAGITYYAIKSNRESANKAALNPQELSIDDLKKLNNSDSTVGDPKQTLTVESNAVFSGKVLIRDGLDVAGPIKVGAALALPGMTVGGISSLETAKIKTLTVSDDAAIQGKLSVQGNLTVTGNASFGGTISGPQLSVDTLKLNSDIQLNRHIDAGGGTPSRSNGGGLGSGGTSSVSGTDTAGTIAINTGSSSPAGCFITVTFAVSFNATPHVVVSPSSSKGAAMDYYVIRTTTGFSLCSASNPPDNTSGITFDYVVID